MARPKRDQPNDRKRGRYDLNHAPPTTISVILTLERCQHQHSMSFQDVGRNKRQTANKGGFGSAPSSGNRIAAAASAAAVGGGGIGGDAFGYEQLSDLIVQFQVSEDCS